MRQDQLDDIQEICNRRNLTWHSDMDVFTDEEGYFKYVIMVTDSLGRWIYSERYTEEMAKESEALDEAKKDKRTEKAEIKKGKKKKLKRPHSEESRAKIKEKGAKKAL